MTLVILVADGARPDTLFRAMDAGQLPALSRLREEGSAHTISSVFPSVTGPAYVPFLLGIHPGRAGIPGIRWWDRERGAAWAPGGTRSYVGVEAPRIDGDLTFEHSTLFELAEHSIGAFTPVGRGLRRTQRIGSGFGFGLRLAWAHFRGDAAAWLQLDRDVAAKFVTRVTADRPDVAFLALFGADKLSHEFGHGSPVVLDAVRIVDDTVARLRETAARDGWFHELEIWVTSDHGHSHVERHDDLAERLSRWGLRVLAHPWAFTGDADAAVMVSGNAMAHIYLDLDRRRRPSWPALRSRWGALVERLLTIDSVDLLLLPRDGGACEVHARGRGMALVTRDPQGRHGYATVSGDPLGLAGVLDSAGAIGGLTADEAHALTTASDYPDSLVQIAALSGAPRSGEILLSAARGWDFREAWEPQQHRSSHGGLHREHLLVPLLLSRAATTTPRRTVDVLPSALQTLGCAVPPGLDGVSWR